MPFYIIILKSSLTLESTQMKKDKSTVSQDCNNIRNPESKKSRNLSITQVTLCDH